MFGLHNNKDANFLILISGVFSIPSRIALVASGKQHFLQISAKLDNKKHIYKKN